MTDEKKGQKPYSRLWHFLLLNLGVALSVLLYVFVLSLLNISCPLRAVLGFRCPACGVTRAFSSLLAGDVSGYLEVQPMALPLAFVFFLEINKGFLKARWGKFIDIISIVTVTLNFFFYLNSFFTKGF